MAGVTPPMDAARPAAPGTADAIESVGIIGAGTMGGGIATALALHGIEVRLHDQDRQRVDAAIDAAGAHYRREVEKGRLAETDAEAARSRLSPALRLADLAPADLVIEAVFEDLALKRLVLAELAAAVSPATLIATNTSCLRIDDLAVAVAAPERFLGLHFFSPAAVNPVVEVVRGKATDAAVLDRALAFCSAIGKRPLRCLDAPGFAINRFFCPYSNEAVRLLDEGLGDAAAIDAAAREAVGAAMGPFAVMNIVKPRINLDAIRHLAPLGAFYAPAAGMVAQGEAGRPWPITALADGAVAGGAADPAARAVLVDRLRGAVFLPVLELLDAAIASPVDIDEGARLALRFAHPPCALMDALGAAAVAALVRPLAERYGRPLPRALERVGRLRG